MGVFHEFTTVPDDDSQEESIRIVQIKSGKKVRSADLRGYLTVYRYRDKDTRQIVSYIPSLEITGYGQDEKKAGEMLKFSLDEYFQYLCSLPVKKCKAELSKLNWKQNPLKHKDYLNSAENIKGQLETLNAVGDKVEKFTLIAK